MLLGRETDKHVPLDAMQLRSPLRLSLQSEASAQVKGRKNLGGKVISLPRCGVCDVQRGFTDFHGNVCLDCEKGMQARRKRDGVTFLRLTKPMSLYSPG